MTGGSAYAVIGIIDTLRFLKPNVSTICVGQTASTASLLLVGLVLDAVEQPSIPLNVMLEVGKVSASSKS